MSTFVHAGCNANHFLDAALDLDNPTPPDFAGTIVKYGVQHLMTETSDSELTDLSSELPTDTHLVTFRTVDGTISADAVRGFTMCDIFDAFADSGLEVISIKSGYGAIKPKLFNNAQKEAKK